MEHGLLTVEWEPPTRGADAPRNSLKPSWGERNMDTIISILQAVYSSAQRVPLETSSMLSRSQTGQLNVHRIAFG